MQYDDGFIAYLNGQEVARQNTIEPRADLIAHWTFDDLANPYADSAGSSDGTLTMGTSAQPAGLIGDHALQLFGTGNVDVGSSNVFETETYTVSAWLNTDTLSGWRTAVGTWHVGNYWMHYGLRSSQQFSNHVFTDNQQRDLIGTSSVQTNRWYHVVSVVDKATRTLQLWVDGVKEQETVLPSWMVTQTPGSNQLHLGTKDGSGNPWSGLLDDIGIWNSALTAAEVRAVYNLGLPAILGSAYDFNYGLEQVQQLFAIHAARGGEATLGTETWAYAEELNTIAGGTTPGDLFQHAGTTYLLLDSSGGGRGLKLAPSGMESGAWHAVAATMRADADAVQFQTFDITPFLNQLQTGTNVLALHGMNVTTTDGDFLIAAKLDAVSLTLDESIQRYFAVPTPGSSNGAGSQDLGPLFSNATHAPSEPGEAEDLHITVRVASTGQGVAEVTLHDRIQFQAERSRTMFDDGLHNDGAAGDGIYGATIPAADFSAGEMVRWYFTAADTVGNESRWPLFDAPLDAPEYFGTVVHDPSIHSPLPVFHWFVENPAAAETGSGTRASVWYDGQFYDNVFVRIRGGTARSWPKKSYKFKFNEGDHFLLRDGVPRKDELNLNTTYTDKSYVRAVLMAEFQNEAGTPSPDSFHMRVEQNGEFYSVAIAVEQPDKDFLRRHDLDTEGALYKAGPGSKYDAGTGSFEKQTRTDEDSSDLQAFITGLAQSDQALTTFLFDNVNLPAQINLMATNILAQNIDGSDKNHYIYRDTLGTGQWQMLPWDLDLTFGPDALNTDRILADQNTAGATYPNAVHPFLGNRDFPLHVGKYNDFLDRMIDDPTTREMLLRRVRSLADEYLATGYFENRIDELVALLGADVALDQAHWGASAHFGSVDYTLQAANDRIKTEYLARRLPYLTEYQHTGGVGIPAAQTDLASLPPEQRGITLGQVEFAPSSGNQDEEFIEIINSNPFAVDVSGWVLSTAVEHRFHPGTVIPAGRSIYVTPSEPAFRDRSTGPSGGQALFVQGNYSGHLSSLGEVIRLTDVNGNEIFSQAYVGAPSEMQQFLRITEINYNPAAPAAAESGAMPAVDNDDFEYIELANIGVQPLDLNGVRFTAGVSFSFPAMTLEPGERVLVVRNQPAFELRYGTGLPVAGSFVDTGLNNSGEQIKLEDALNNTIHDFAYDSKGDWPELADGLGSALTVIDVHGNYSDPFNWFASGELNGTPGTTGSDIAVMARKVFYSGSSFTGNNAIATDKDPLFEGRSADFDNYTSYLHGLNGLYIDVLHLADGGNLSAADFAFHVGNSDHMPAWLPLNEQPDVTVGAGQGVGGSDRVALTWPNQSIQQTWLQVRLLANETTGLVRDDVFYYGNAVGETGNRNRLNAHVDGFDFAGTRDHAGAAAAIDHVNDFNRDGLVDGADLAIVRDHATHFDSALRLISPTLAAPPPPLQQGLSSSFVLPASEPLVRSDSISVPLDLPAPYRAAARLLLRLAIQTERFAVHSGKEADSAAQDSLPTGVLRDWIELPGIVRASVAQVAVPTQHEATKSDV